MRGRNTNQLDLPSYISASSYPPKTPFLLHRSTFKSIATVSFSPFPSTRTSLLTNLLQKSIKMGRGQLYMSSCTLQGKGQLYESSCTLQGNGQLYESSCTLQGKGQLYESSCSLQGKGQLYESSCTLQGNGQLYESSCTMSRN
jgi:hypothetical protein